jgi:ABC-type branched-subunit amino acid transport system permease subunit
VVLGGAGSVQGAIIGALLVGGLDQLVIPLGGAAFDRAAATAPWLAALSPRSLNYLVFGLMLYLAIRLRNRPSAASESGGRLPWRWLRA